MSRPIFHQRRFQFTNRPDLWGLLWLALLPGLMGTPARAEETTLKNGTVLQGSTFQTAGLTVAGGRANNAGPVPNISYWVIDDGVRRFFVHRRIVEKQTEGAASGANVSFQLKHERQSRTAGFSAIGGFGAVQPFDEFGRRTVTLPTQKGMVPVIQGIKELRPQVTDLESLTHVWDYSVDTRTLPNDVIQSVITKSSNRNLPAERKAAVLFYVQAQMFLEAQEELRQLAERFPDQVPWCEEYGRLVGELIARKAINEIERRQAAGQHLLAMQYARQFPTDQIGADVRQKALDVLQTYEQAIAARDRVLLQLDVLQAAIPPEKSARLASMRALVQEELHYENMSRLDPFLRSQDDDTLSAEEKLSLAYSGWLLGDAGAVLNLDETVRLWDARFLLLEFLRLRQDPLREEELLEKLEAIEGISLTRAAQMLEFLPLPFEPPRLTPGTTAEMEIPATSETPAMQYTVLLPPEYTPAHRYPLLVVLRGERGDFANEVRWWAGDADRPGWAQRRGYIVIAPHYCPEGATSYEADEFQQAVVLHSIQHARKRFHIDSDRIFLAGHGMGADACFDLGMAAPGWFAGVIPIAGIAPAYCRPCWDNAPHLSWYVVGGEKDRNALEKNSSVLNEMMKHGQDVIYCEYKERGFEGFAEEQERLFAWMQSLRRAPMKECARWEANSMHPYNNTFFWMQARLIPERPATSTAIPRPMKYEGAITPGGTIYISHPGKGTTVWISPELFDFTNRCQVRVNLKHVFNDYLQPSLGALLTDLRERGDRQRLYWARLDL